MTTTLPMLSLGEVVRCAPLASAATALGSLVAAPNLLSHPVAFLESPDPNIGVVALIVSALSALRVLRSGLIGSEIRSTGSVASDVSPRRAQRIAHVVLGADAFLLASGRWASRVSTDKDGNTIVRSTVDDDDNKP